MKKVLFLIALCALPAACGDSSAPASLAEHADAIRAGDHELSDADLDRLPRWSLGRTPEVVIGSAMGTDGQDLIGVVSAIRLSTGTIVVANSGTSDVRYFDADGTLTRTVGRAGRGPGEFEGLASLVRLPADGIGVWDFLLKRLTMLDSRGDLVAERRLDHLEGFGARVYGYLADATFAASPGFDVAARFVSGSGFRSDTTRLVRVSEDGALKPIGSLQIVDDQYFSIAGRGFASGSVPFGQRTWFGVHERGFVTADNGSFEISWHSVDGEVEAVVRGPPLGGTLTRAERDAAIRAMVDDLPPMQAEPVAELLRRFPHSARRAVLQALHVSVDGRAWVQVERNGRSTPEWLVLDRAGGVARVAVPADLEVLEIGETHLVAKRLDAEGIERVEVYRITPAA